MSQADTDVAGVADHVVGAAHKDATPTTLFAAMLPGFVRLILERLDAIVDQIKIGNRRLK